MTTLTPVRCRDIEWRIYVQFDGATWTDISRDVLESFGVQWDRGSRRGGATDLVAETGSLVFSLNNSHVNSVGMLGHYSPAHDGARQGFRIGVLCMLSIAFQGRPVTQFVGRVKMIEPLHGVLGPRSVRVTVKDWMDEAAKHKLKSLPVLIDVTTDEAAAAVVAAMPIQPPGGTDFDEGIDEFPLAFDDVRDGNTTAMTELAKLARSGAREYFFLTKDGALKYQNRQTRVADTRNLFTMRGTMQDVVVGRSADDIINQVDVTVHPRTVDPDYAVLWSLEGSPLVPAGQTVPFTGDYIDPANPGERIGAVDVQEPVADIDYVMSGAATSTGSPDTPKTFLAESIASNDGWSGTVESLSDGSEASGMTPPNALAYVLFNFGDIPVPPAANNAAVSGVRIFITVSQPSDNGHVNWYVRSVLGGIVQDTPALGISGQGSAAGIYSASYEIAVAPGAAPWTVAGYNPAEIGFALNWAGGTPTVVETSIQLLYSSQVDDNDHTADFTIVTVRGGNSAAFEVTNNGSSGAYITKLQIRGRPARQYTPISMPVRDEESIASLGESSEALDMAHQADVNIGTSAGEYILYLYGEQDLPSTVSFIGNLSAEHMNAALDREIGDRIGLAEEVTGIRDTNPDGHPRGHHIVGISGQILPGPVVLMTWRLTPADERASWQFEVEGRDEFEENTVWAIF